MRERRGTGNIIDLREVVTGPHAKRSIIVLRYGQCQAPTCKQTMVSLATVINTTAQLLQLTEGILACIQCVLLVGLQCFILMV